MSISLVLVNRLKLTIVRRSYGELDLLFEQKVPARKFKTTVVNEFEGEGQAAQVGGAIVH